MWSIWCSRRPSPPAALCHRFAVQCVDGHMWLILTLGCHNPPINADLKRKPFLSVNFGFLGVDHHFGCPLRRYWKLGYNSSWIYPEKRNLFYFYSADRVRTVQTRCHDRLRGDICPWAHIRIPVWLSLFLTSSFHYVDTKPPKNHWLRRNVFVAILHLSWPDRKFYEYMEEEKE